MSKARSLATTVSTGSVLEDGVIDYAELIGAPVVNNTFNRQVYSATVGQTTFSITYEIGFVDVYLNGVKLVVGSDFTATNGTSVVLAAGASAGDVVDIIAYGTFEVANTYTQAAADGRFATITALQPADIGVTVQGYDANITTATNTQTLTNKTLAEPIVTGYTESTVATGTVSSSHTIDLTNGTFQTATLTASTACTFTMPSATSGKSFLLVLKQAATTGNGTATFTGVLWAGGTAPTVTAAAGSVDVFSFVSDGTSWYGSATQDFS